MADALSRSVQKKMLFRLAIAQSDIAAAVFTCKAVEREVSSVRDDLYKPLLHAAAIAYARPFVTSRAGSKLSSKWARYENPVHQRTHDQLLALRHNFVAHSDPTERIVQIVPPGVQLYEGAKQHFERPGIAVRDVAYPLEWIDLVHATTLDLGTRLQAEVGRLLDDLYGARKLPEQLFPLTFDDDL